MATGKEKTTIKDAATTVVFSPDGKILASSCSGKLWEVATGNEIKRHKFEGGLFAFSPDGKMLASHCMVWELATGKERANGARRKEFLEITSVAFSPDGRTLAFGSSDQSIKLWDLSRLVRPER